MSDPTKLDALLPPRLAHVLARGADLLVDDARAAELVRVQTEASALEQRTERAERLRQHGVQLRPEVQRALERGAALEEGASLAACRRWLPLSAEAKPALVLVGGTGCGKTVAAAWALANGPRSCVWRTAPSVVRCFAGFFGEALLQQQRILECELLILEDVGTEFEPQRMGVALVEIFEHRRTRQRRTLMTTNMRAPEFRALYPDSRLHSRLALDSTWVLDAGADRRLS